MPSSYIMSNEGNIYEKSIDYQVAAHFLCVCSWITKQICVFLIVIRCLNMLGVILRSNE